MSVFIRDEQDQLWVIELKKNSQDEILAAMAAYKAEGRPIWKPMNMQPMYWANPFIMIEGNGRGRTDAYINGFGTEVGADFSDMSSAYRVITK